MALSTGRTRNLLVFSAFYDAGLQFLVRFIEAPRHSRLYSSEMRRRLRRAIPHSLYRCTVDRPPLCGVVFHQDAGKAFPPRAASPPPAEAPFFVHSDDEFDDDGCDGAST